jgi:hypothetical protein
MVTSLRRSSPSGELPRFARSGESGEKIGAGTPRVDESEGSLAAILSPSRSFGWISRWFSGWITHDLLGVSQPDQIDGLFRQYFQDIATAVVDAADRDIRKRPKLHTNPPRFNFWGWDAIAWSEGLSHAARRCPMIEHLPDPKKARPPEWQKR